MDDYPLSGLTPNDPENLLSREARIRIKQAALQAEAARVSTDADLRVAEDARTKTKAEIEEGRYQSRLIQARSVLRVTVEELIKSERFADEELMAVIRDEVESACYSLELKTHRTALEYEMCNLAWAERANRSSHTPGTSPIIPSPANHAAVSLSDSETIRRRRQMPASRQIEIVPPPYCDSWDQLEITFLKEDTIQIKTPGGIKNYTHETFGLADRRNWIAKGNKAWDRLRDLAEGAGVYATPAQDKLAISAEGDVIQPRRHGRRQQESQEEKIELGREYMKSIRKAEESIHKSIGALRRHLESIWTDCDGDPIPTNRKGAYEAQFKPRIGPSYD